MRGVSSCRGVAVWAVVVSGLWAMVGVFSAPRLHASDDWPNWRGPTYNGISTAKKLPEKWSPTEGIAWKFKMPGPAGSTPVVAGHKLYATSADGDDLVLLCLNLKGEQLWKEKLGTGNRVSRGDEGNMAAPSPSTDGSHVWSFRLSEGSAANAGIRMPVPSAAEPRILQLVGGERYSTLVLPAEKKPSGGDGSTTDTDGRVYVTSHAGIQMFDRIGRLPAGLAALRHALILPPAAAPR